MALIEKLSHHSWEIILILVFAACVGLRQAPSMALVLGPYLRWVSRGLVVIGLVASATYLFLPQFYDHIEPQVVITALNGASGLPYHPDWMRGEGAFGVLYGPFLYQVESIALHLSRSIFASKLIFVLAFGFASAVVWRNGAAARDAYTRSLTYAYLLALATFGVMAFWVRSEPLLLALTAMAVLSSASSRRLVTALGIGLAAGLATATKIHGSLYFVPLAALQAARWSSPRQATQALAVASSAFVLGALLPFGFDPGRISVFLKYVAKMASHGLSARLLFANLTSAAVLVAPYVAVVVWSRAWAWSWRSRLEPAAVALAMGAVVVIGAKPGSGPHHLMPFVPVLAYLTVRGLATGREADRPTPRVWPTALLAGITVGSVIPLLMTLNFLFGSLAGLTRARTGYAEAVALTVRYPGAQFGPTDMANYSDLTYRTGAALRGARLTFDNAAWMDFAAAGVEPRDDPRDFAFDRRRVWIFPTHGRPFSFISVYTKAPLFPADFQAAFAAHCRRVEARVVFAVWVCAP